MRFVLSAAFPLTAKLVSGFLLVTVPALAVMAAISLYALSELVGANHHLYEISRSREAVRGLETAIERAIAPLAANFADAGSVRRRLQVSFQEVDSRLQSCSSGHCHQASRHPEAMAQTLVPYIDGIRSRAVLLLTASTAQEVKLRVLDEIDRQGEEIKQRLEAMSSALLVRVSSLEDASREVDRRAVQLIIVSVLLILLLAAATAYLLSRRLLKHVGELLAGTRHIIQGDLGYRVAVAERDEIGQLAQSFNAMAEELQEHRQGLERMVKAKTAELEQARDSLVQSEKLASIGLLASGVAHELNNPLTSILMNANLLMEDAEDHPDLRKELQRIVEDTVRCKRIIDDLRDFSRRHELDVAPTDLNRLVEDCLALMDGPLRAQHVSIVRRYLPGVPPVSCDPARMEQVLTNIFSNALQAMPQGGRLTVATALRTHHAEISIEDTGPGIPGEIRSRIFDPFFTTKPQGTGLGLSIVYRIMEAHGGKVEVQSVTRAGGGTPAGTKMLLLLPLGKSNADTPAAAGSAD